MDRRFKKILSVLVAVLIGAGIIFFAWRSGSAVHTESSLSAKSGDAWKDSLSVVPQTFSTETKGLPQVEATGIGATTTTDIVARELLTNYALAQKSNMSTTTLSDEEAQAIAQTAVDKIDLPRAKQYTEKNLNISGDNSASAISVYSKEIATLAQTFAMSQTKNDIAVAFTIPKTDGDTKRLAGIAEQIAHYEKFIRGLLALKTPSLIAQPHLHLIQKYADIQVTIEPMANIFTDPLKGLAGLAEYRQQIAGLPLITEEFQTSFSKIQ